jgi:hypothetical protein
MAISPDSMRSNTCIDIMFQNLRALKEEKGEEFILRMVQRNLWADRRQNVRELRADLYQSRPLRKTL